MSVDDAFTKVLLHFNGSDGATTFTDEGGKTWTAHGAAGGAGVFLAQLDTARQKFGASSLLLQSANSTYIDTPDSTDFYFGTGAFCIDFWMRVNTLPAAGADMAIYSRQSDISNFARLGIFRKADDSGSQLYFYVKQAGVATVELYRDASISLNTWYHVALTRSGNDWRLFLDGTQLGASLEDASPVFNIASEAYIGQRGTGAMYFNGWLDEFRISKGTARWTADFTPPSVPYAPVTYTGEAGIFFV